MRKSGLIIIAFSMIILASCDYRTCPTYTRKPPYFRDVQRVSIDKEVPQNTEEVKPV